MPSNQHQPITPDFLYRHVSDLQAAARALRSAMGTGIGASITHARIDRIDGAAQVFLSLANELHEFEQQASR